MRPAHLARYLAVVLAAVSLTGAAQADPSGSYRFVPIVDSSGPLSFPGFGAINNRGTVAIHSRLDTFGGQAILLWDRGEIRQIASVGVFGNLAGPSLNDRGEVSFMLSESGKSAFLKWRDGQIVERIDEGGRFEWLLCCPWMNNRGAMTVFGVLDGIEGIYTVDRGRITTIADSTGPYTYFGPADDINDRGQVTVAADPDDPERAAILLGDGRRTTVVVDASGPFEFFPEAVVNNSGVVAVQAFPDGLDPTPSILVRDQHGLRVFVDFAGPFEFPDRPLLNNSGLLVFTSTLDAGGNGVFTGPDPQADKVLGTGDPLAGSMVVQTAATGVNDAGEIVLYVELADGRRGLWLAVPHP